MTHLNKRDESNSAYRRAPTWGGPSFNIWHVVAILAGQCSVAAESGGALFIRANGQPLTTTEFTVNSALGILRTCKPEESLCAPYAAIT
jgi:hypothetical protein